MKKYTITNLWDDLRPVCKKHGCELEAQEHNGYVFYVCPQSAHENGYHNERIPIFIYTDFIDEIAKELAEEGISAKLNGKIMKSKRFIGELKKKSHGYDLEVNFEFSR